MGLALLATIWLISFVSSDFFIAKTWCLAVGFTAAGVDRQFTVTCILTATVFVLAPVCARPFVWRYRDQEEGQK